MDLTFDEDVALKKSRKCQFEEVYEEVLAPRVAESMEEVALSPDDEISEDHDMWEPKECTHMTISHKRKLSWARKITQDAERYGAPEVSSR